MKSLYILGSCGSIGLQTLDIVRNNLTEFKVIGLTVGSNLEIAQKVIDEFKPEIICVRKKEDIDKIKSNAYIVYGDDGILKVATFNKDDKDSLLVNALVGTVGLRPTIESIKIKRNIALANKETLVMAGDIVNELLNENGVKLFPIDSEHSAIWQCLRGENINDISSIIITASGGSFRDKTREELKNVTVTEALNHPNWSMGSKITIDSATMVNKGYEVIEAHHLFNLDYKKIKTILHRQSIIHSFVEFKDNSIKAVLGTQDMRIPILYALNEGEHKYFHGENLNLENMSKLEFAPLTTERFPCLEYAYYVGEKGGVYPSVFHAANEAAVNLFLNGQISFLEIENIIKTYIYIEYDFLNPTIEDILDLNKKIRNQIFEEYGVKK